MSREVRIERDRNRILLASNFPTPGLKADIPGSNWRDSIKAWSLPLDLTTCKLLRERFGDRLVIGPDLMKWAKEEKAAQSRAADLAAAADADLFLLPEVAPTLYAATAHRRYQRSGIRFILEARGRDDRRRALVADTVGLGKTAQSIGAVMESGLPGPYLIVAPKTAAELTWGAEIRRWLGDDARVITLPDSKAKRDSLLSALATDYNRNPASLARTWVIAHPAIVRTQTWWICMECAPATGADRKPIRYDLLRWVKTPSATKYKAGVVKELDCGHEKTHKTPIVHDHTFPQLFTMQYGALIADESDQILIRLTATPNLQRRGMEMLRDLVVPNGLRIAMSGTPFRSKPHQIWSTLNWLDPVRWSAKWSFVQRYWECTDGYYGGKTIGNLIADREQLLIADLSDVMIRRTRDMVRADLPAKMYPSNVDPKTSGLTAGIYLPMTPEQNKAYRQMEQEGAAEVSGKQLQAIGVLAELTRLKQFAAAPGTFVGEEFRPKAAGNKYEWLLEFLTEMGLPDKPSSKVVIASQFTKLLNVFAEGLAKDLKLDGDRFALVTGEVTGAHRQAAVEKFEDLNSSLDILFINTKAGGSSITLDAADVMVILDETWVDDEQQQLEGRIDNRNPERRIAPRSYYYLRSFDTLEESIGRANAEAKARGERILDGAQIVRRSKELLNR